MINLMDFATVENANPNAMITDVAPPPPPGKYRVKLVPAEGVKFKEDHVDESVRGKDAFMITQQGQLVHNEKGFITFFYLKADVARKRPYPQAVLVPKVLVQDGNDVREVNTDRLYASTMILKGLQTSMVDSLIRGITGQTLVGVSDAQKIGMLYQYVVNGQAILTAECDWEGRWADAEVTKDSDGVEQKDYPLGILGGKKLSSAVNFPRDAQGNLMPVEVDDKGNLIRTKLVIKKWLPAAAPQQ